MRTKEKEELETDILGLVFKNILTNS